MVLNIFFFATLRAGEEKDASVCVCVCVEDDRDNWKLSVCLSVSVD